MRGFSVELIELILVPEEHAAVGIAVLPFLNKIAAVLARALLICVLRIVHRFWQEPVTSTPEDDVEAVSIWPRGKLLGDVLASCCYGFRGLVGIALPIT